MNLEDYRTIFIGASLVLMLIAASPGLGVVIPFFRGGERFSELWILGPAHTAEDYPFNVRIGEMEQVFVRIGNHMERSAYYVLYVKLRNQTQAAPSSKTSTPSPIIPLYAYRVFVADGETWETPLTFLFLEASHSGVLLNITKISINDVIFDNINYLSSWDSENLGFYYQLFFELWVYDYSVSDFRYRNPFVGIWLNMTA